MNASIAGWFEAETGRALLPETARPVGGGCIHSAQLVEAVDGGLVFMKENQADLLPLFEAESRSLALLREPGAIRTPEPFCLGVVEGRALFAMEGLRLSNRSDAGSQQRLGHELARLHATAPPHGRFGADFDNYIGATPQPNPWADTWADFYAEHRLAHQFRLAARKGRRFADEEALLGRVHAHLSSLDVAPSLLHGDLWGGNVSFDEAGAPVVYDPATYHGDREADIAFTRMFGGFGPGFYEAYREIHPAPEPVREPIYNLYHVLNHFVLFGGGYASQAEAMIREILGAV